MKKLFIKIIAVVCVASFLNISSGKVLHKQKAYFDPGIAYSRY